VSNIAWNSRVQGDVDLATDPVAKSVGATRAAYLGELPEDIISYELFPPTQGRHLLGLMNEAGSSWAGGA